MSNRLAHVVAALTCVALLGCASAIQLYPGSARPADQVAVLKIVTNGAITSISGRELEGKAYALLPAKYPIKFRVIVPFAEYFESAKGSNQRVIAQCDATVDAEAGHEYRLSRTRPGDTLAIGTYSIVDARRFSARFEMKVYVVDVGPNEKVMGASEANCEWPGMEVRQE